MAGQVTLAKVSGVASLKRSQNDAEGLSFPPFPLSLRPLPLRVPLRLPAPPSLFSGGFAGWRRREGGGRSVHSRSRFSSSGVRALSRFGAMPVEFRWPTPAGGARRLGVMLLLLTALRWTEPKVTSSVAFPSTQNKPGVAPELADLEIPSHFLAVTVTARIVGDGIWPDPSGSGVGGGDLLAALTCSRRRLAAASVGCCFYGGVTLGSASSAAISSSTLQAEWRPLPPGLLVAESQRREYFNLQLRRPASSTVFGSRCGDPSGHVPGVAAVEHGRMQCEFGGDGDGARLDRVLHPRSKVLCAKFRDLCVILYLFRVLVFCTSTALS